MKKIINSLKAVVLLTVVALVVSCAESGLAIQNYLNLSDSTISFQANPTEPFKIGVEASGEWTYTIDDEWISVESEDETGLSIVIEPNTYNSMRYAGIVFKCGDIESTLLVYQNCVSANVNLEVNSLFADGAVSPSGVFVAGMSAFDDTTAKPTLINTETNEVLKYPAMDNTYVVSCVDDKGDIFINSSTMTSGYYIEYGTASAVQIMVPNFIAGDGSDCRAGVNGVSGDGSIWVGYCCPTKSKDTDNPFGGGWYPVRWVDGVPEMLPFDENNSIGEKMWYGCAARGCSADGSVIYGNYLDYSDAIYWDKESVMHFVAPELTQIGEYENLDGSTGYTRVGGAVINADSHIMSQNGKFLAFQVEDRSSGFKSITPAYINTETGAYYLKDGYSGVIIAIGNDETLFFTPQMQYGPTTVVMADGTEMEGMDWIEKSYGIIIEDERAILQVTDRGNIFGYKGTGSSTYAAWWLTKY